MFRDKVVIAQMGVQSAYPVDLPTLTGTQGLIRIKAPDPLEEPLPAQDLMNARDAAGISIRRIEDRGVGIGDFGSQAQQFRWHGLVGSCNATTAGMEFNGLPG